jgi:hypothetical protein
MINGIYFNDICVVSFKITDKYVIQGAKCLLRGYQHQDINRNDNLQNSSQIMRCIFEIY